MPLANSVWISSISYSSPEFSDSRFDDLSISCFFFGQRNEFRLHFFANCLHNNGNLLCNVGMVSVHFSQDQFPFLEIEDRSGHLDDVSRSPLSIKVRELVTNI